MLCRCCSDICVRPYALYSCKHVVCSPCLNMDVNASADILECPVCHSVGAGHLMRSECAMLELNMGNEYRRIDRRKMARTDYRTCDLADAENQVELISVQDVKRKTRSNMRTKKTQLYYYLDFEATNCTPMTCRITQIGCVAETADGGMVEYDSYVRADQKICEAAARVTGMTDDMLKNAPECSRAIRSFLDWIEDTRDDHPVTLVAHNGIGFDFPLLLSEMSRWNMHPYTTLVKVGVTRMFDSLAWSRCYLPSHKLIKNDKGMASRKLGDIYESLFGERFDNAHDALADCRAMRRICESEYCRRKQINMADSDSHICMDLKEYVDRYQTKRESIDTATRKNLFAKVASVARRTKMSMFKSADKKSRQK